MQDGIGFRLAGGQNPLLLIPVFVNGKGPYQFILDTGASHCLLSPELFRELALVAEAEKQAMGAGGPVQVTLARISTLEVASARRDNVQVAVTSEIERIGAAIQSQVDGLLGFDFLSGFMVEIDYEESIVRLVSPFAKGNETGSRPGRAVPFRLASASKPVIMVPAIVNGAGPFDSAVDTGA